MFVADAVWPIDQPRADLIELVRDAANVVRQGEDSTETTLRNTHAGWIAAIYATRCTRNLRAVAVLCEAGLGSEASHVVRAMLEDAVTMTYIEDDEEARAEQYVDFEEVRAYHYMEEAVRGGFVGAEDERVRELRAAFEDVDELDTLWWSGLSPGRMASKLANGLALKRDFFGMYPLLSDEAHGNAMMARNYVVQDEDGATKAFVDAPTMYRIDEMCCLAIYCAWRLADAAHSCGLGVETAELQSVLENASTIYRRLNPISE